LEKLPVLQRGHMSSSAEDVMINIELW
jgi:hypothetical protein